MLGCCVVASCSSCMFCVAGLCTILGVCYGAVLACCPLYGTGGSDELCRAGRMQAPAFRTRTPRGSKETRQMEEAMPKSPKQKSRQLRRNLRQLRRKVRCEALLDASRQSLTHSVLLSLICSIHVNRLLCHVDVLAQLTPTQGECSIQLETVCRKCDAHQRKSSLERNASSNPPPYDSK